MENIQIIENCKFSCVPSGNKIDRLAAPNIGVNLTAMGSTLVKYILRGCFLKLE